MKDKVTLLQNFICTSNERFQFMKTNTPKLGKVLGKWPCVVNFDIKNKFTDKIKNLYEYSFENLVFENNIDINWCDWMIDKLEKIQTPYVIYLIEDVEIFDIFSHKMLNEILIDMKKFDVKHLLLGKVQKYMTKVEKRMVAFNADTEVRHFYFHNALSTPYRFNSFTLSAMFERQLMLDTIKIIRAGEKDKWRLNDTIWMLDKFEKIGMKRLNKQKVAVPNKVYVGVSDIHLPDEAVRNKKKKKVKTHKGRWKES